MPHLPLDGRFKVLRQMKPVGDLSSPRGALPGGLSVETASVPAHDFDVGMLLEPMLRARRRSDRQNIGNRTPLQIDDDRAVGVATSPAPVIDSYDPQGRFCGLAIGMTFEMS